MARKTILKTGALYLGTGLFTVAVLSVVMRLWMADISIPFTYYWDSLYNGALIKGVIDNGWYLYNGYAGMPTGLYLHDFPNPSLFYFLIIKGISLLSRNYGTIMNSFYLMGFPLAALSSLFVFRQLGLSFAPSILGSILFSFLPYHFFRGEMHLFLASYFVIPPMVLVILWVAEGRALFIRRDPATLRLRVDAGLESMLALTICIVMSSSGVYYAAFGCFFLLIAGLFASSRSRTLRPLLVSALLIGIVFTGVLANLAPNMYYAYRHGANREVPQRSPMEAEMYGLKITQMLLPVSGHRLPALAKLKSRYNRFYPLNESDSASLGIVGSCGFLILMGWLIFRKPDSEKPRQRLHGTLDQLSILNLSALLLATMGGFSSLVAMYISPLLRAYNRISVYIAFFSILAVVILFEKIHDRWIRSVRSRILFHTMLAITLFLGIYDQTTDAFVPPYDQTKKVITDQTRFVNTIESNVPERGMIFQLPYVPFPESPPPYDMGDYDHFASGYLHSRTLRWSYGAMRGREGDLWQRMITEKPLKDFIRTLAFSGFSGISLDRFGYPDRGADVESRLKTLLGIQPVVSPDSRYVFFPLGEYIEDLQKKYSGQEWEVNRDQSLHPVLLKWRRGFSDIEGSGDTSARRCSASGELHLFNLSPVQKRVMITMSVTTGYRDPSSLTVKSSTFLDRLMVSAEASPYSKVLLLSPGRTIIKFTCDARPAIAPGSSRAFVFIVRNFTLQEIK